MDNQGKVTVFSDNILKPPLVDSSEARMIVIRDSEGKPMLLVIRISGDTWGVASSTDKDWKTVLERYRIK